MAFTPEQIVERRATRKAARIAEKTRQWDAAMVAMEKRRAREDEERCALHCSDVAQQLEQCAMRLRSVGLFDSAFESEEQALQVRRSGQYVMMRGFAPDLHERIALSMSREWIWDQLVAEGVMLEHPRPYGPSRNGSSSCESGSVASGGARTYCTCDRCW